MWPHRTYVRLTSSSIFPNCGCFVFSFFLLYLSQSNRRTMTIILVAIALSVNELWKNTAQQRTGEKERTSGEWKREFKWENEMCDVYVNRKKSRKQTKLWLGTLKSNALHLDAYHWSYGAHASHDREKWSERTIRMLCVFLLFIMCCSLFWLPVLFLGGSHKMATRFAYQNENCEQNQGQIILALFHLFHVRLLAHLFIYFRHMRRLILILYTFFICSVYIKRGDLNVPTNKQIKNKF